MERVLCPQDHDALIACMKDLDQKLAENPNDSVTLTIKARQCRITGTTLVIEKGWAQANAGG